MHTGTLDGMFANKHIQHLHSALTSNTACCVGRIVILWENLMRNITVLVVFCFLKINIVNLEINC